MLLDWRPTCGLGYTGTMTPVRANIHPAVAAFRRPFLTVLLIVASLIGPPALAQDLDEAFARLADPANEAWRMAESDILRDWSRSGSPAMDLLLQRGEAALDAGDTAAAIGHLTALTDHAPDFAAGFQARAAAYATIGQFGPALADLARTLTLEPRHFAALTQLAVMLEEMGQDDRAAQAYRDSLAIHPHQQEAIDGLARLDAKRQGLGI